MSTLFHRRYIPVPYDRARRSLEDSIKPAASAGEPQTVRLRVPLPGTGTDGDARALEKDVSVTYGLGRDPLHFDQPWTLHWTPSDGGPFPDFDGTLTIRADDDYRSCALELRGRYEPPLGMPGAIFDAVVGSRIASSTARELLKQLGDAIESRYREEEAQKSAL